MAFAAVLLGATIAFATPTSAEMNFGSSVTLGDNDPVSSSDSSSWLGVPTNLSVNATAVAFADDSHNGTAFGIGSSTFAADGNSGSVFLNWGWDGKGVNALNTNQLSPNWSYTFTADFTGTFELSYDIVGSGATFGLQQITLGADTDTFSGPIGGDVYDPTASGLFTGGVTFGQTYTVTLSNFGNEFISLPDTFDSKGSATGHFDWVIKSNGNPVPDSGSTAVLLGLALVGLACVRRRH